MIDPAEIMIWKAAFTMEARKVLGRRRISAARSAAIDRWAHSMALIAEQHFRLEEGNEDDAYID